MTLHKHWKGITLFLLPALILFAAFFIYPLGFVFSISLTEWNGVTAPQFRGVKNFVDLVLDDTFRLSVRNNFIWALSLGFLQIFLAAMVAMILTRRPAGWRVLRTVYFLPNVISQVAIAMLWMAIYNADHGILNQILMKLGLESWTHNWLGEIETALPAVIAQQVLYIGYFMIIVLAGIATPPPRASSCPGFFPRNSANRHESHSRYRVPAKRRSNLPKHILIWIGRCPNICAANSQPKRMSMRPQNTLIAWPMKPNLSGLA